MNRLTMMKFGALAVLIVASVAFPDTVGANVLANVAAGGGLLFAGSVLDVFKTDPFNVISMTDAINKIPFVAGRAGQVIDWNEQGVPTTSIMLEEVNGVLTIINPSPRGGPGAAIAKQKRTARTLTIPHYQRDDAIYADEVQGVREFGQEQSVKTVQGVVNARMAEHATDMDLTLEYQRVGAVKGVILNGDGSTLYDLFSEFGVSQDAEVDFDLDAASPAAGVLRKACAAQVRAIADHLGGIGFSHVHAFCGDAFFDDLMAHTEVRASYIGTSMAEVLRTGYVLPNGQKIYGAFEFGGIVWENYRGTYSGTSKIIDTNKCHLFPMGVPRLFRTVYAPADYVETVNTIGLPRYAKQFPMLNGKGISIEMQSNALSYCTRPNVLIKGKRT